MLPLPLTDAMLRLTLPFPSSSFLLRVWLLVCLVCFLIGFVVRVQRRELKTLSRDVSHWLLGFRLTVLIAIAFTIAADPTLIRTRTEDVPGRVLVAIDQSDSMRVTDPNRAIVDKLRLARALKLVGELASDNEVDSWIVTFERSSSASFGSDGERSRFDKVIARMDSLSRLGLCRKILTPDGLRLLEAIGEKHTLDLFGFDVEIGPLPVEASRLEKALDGIQSTNGRPLLCTDLKLPLTRALEAGGDDLLGVVILTDGRHNWGESPITRAQELGQRKVPIYPIVMAPREAPADVAIVSARSAAGTVFKGSTVPVDVVIRITSWPAGPIRVKLTHGELVLEEVIEHTGTDATCALSFRVTCNESGPQRMTVEVEPGSQDRIRENDRRTVRVNVVQDRARVMLIDGEARWEFHYLHTCLGRDPNMDVRSVVFRQPRINRVREEDLRASGVPARMLPENPDALSGYDLIVLGDVELDQINPEQWERIEKYVADSGGTLVISAGKRAMPRAYPERSPLRKLLPIRDLQTIESIEGFPLVLTPAGERCWFLAMGDTGGESRTQWNRLPWHHWAIAGEPKDGAEVLATEPNGKALVARQNYGFGRVLYLGIDSTWRWRYKAGDQFHHRFWGQVAQWAASDKLLPVSNAAGTIRFGPREPVYIGGQPVEIVVRAAESVKKLPAEARKAARIIRLPIRPEDKEITAALVTLSAPEGRPLDLQATVSDLKPGRYAVELDIPAWTEELIGPPGSDGRAQNLRALFEVEPPDSEEMIDVSANWALLTEIAHTGGGQVLMPEKAREVVELLASRTATRQVSAEIPLRQSWWTYAFFLLLLATEWIARKWHGLP